MDRVLVRRVYVLGVAPGTTALTPEALERIGSCDLLVSAARHRELVGECGGDFGGEFLPVEGHVSEAVKRVAENTELKAAFLASGDPGFFGIASLLVAKIGAAEVEIVPAVSSMQLAFSRLGVSWSDASMASLHGRGIDGLAPVLGAPKIGLFTDDENNPAAIARYLIDAGWGELSMGVCTNLGMEDERVSWGIVPDFLDWNDAGLSVVVLVRTGTDPRPLGPGLEEERFVYPRGRITKREVRSAALGLLSLPRAGVLWDIGAGSGSVGIEAFLLSSTLKVFSVERDDEAFGHIVENRKKLRAAGVTPVHGLAPEALTDLPDPDRVFIGGSGGNLNEVLDLCAARIADNGVIVVSAVLDTTFSDAVGWAQRTGWECEWTEIIAARSSRTGAGVRKVAQNPITLIRITRA